MGEVVVYWACQNHQYEAPEPDFAVHDLHDRVIKMSDQFPERSSMILRCPVAVGHLKNTFRVKSPIDYDITWKDSNKFVTTQQDQNFFDNSVFIRDYKTGLLTYKFASYIFFTEEENLDMEIRHANYCNKSHATNTSFLEGSINIGKYFRAIDCAFFINHPDVLVSVNRGDALYYTKFNTTKKVRFKKFLLTPEILNFKNAVVDAVKFVKPGYPNTTILDRLKVYYEIFKTSHYKKLIIKHIKNNLLN